jgi:hypothetical protein
MNLLNVNSIVIEQPWGGLGDNLQFSTLPERFAAQGIPVFIAENNAARNREIYELVWGCNPHISGISLEPANAGFVRLQEFGRLPPFTNFIQRWETAHDLTPLNHFPKVYYTPKPRPELANIVLVDLGSTSVVPSRRALRRYMKYLITRFQYPSDAFRQVEFAMPVSRSTVPLFGHIPSLRIRDIFDYCDAIAGCAVFITVHSGAMSLASALRGDSPSPVIHSFTTDKQYNARAFIYGNVEYFVRGVRLEQKLKRLRFW